MWFIHLNKHPQKSDEEDSGGKKKKKLLYTKAASAFQILALEPSQLVPSVPSISNFIVKPTPSLISGVPGSYNTQHSSCASLAASVQTEMWMLDQRQQSNNNRISSPFLFRFCFPGSRKSKRLANNLTYSRSSLHGHECWPTALNSFPPLAQ